MYMRRILPIGRRSERTGVRQQAGERADAPVGFHRKRRDVAAAIAGDDHHASRRIKEKQGARLVDLMIGEYVAGRGPQMVWLLRREDWLARETNA